MILWFEKLRQDIINHTTNPCDDCDIMRFDDEGNEFEDCEECKRIEAYKED